MIQEVKAGVDTANKERILPVYQRNNKRALKSDISETVPPFHLYNRIGPKFPENASYNHPEVNTQTYNICLNEYHVWFLARVLW